MDIVGLIKAGLAFLAAFFQARTVREQIELANLRYDTTKKIIADKQAVDAQIAERVAAGDAINADRLRDDYAALAAAAGADAYLKSGGAVSPVSK